MIQVDKRGQEIWGKDQGVATLVNTDLINPVFIEYGTSQPTSSSDQIPPLGSITVDGTTSVRASTLSSLINVAVQPMRGVLQWSASPAQIAEQIALTGINVNVIGLSVIPPSSDVTGATEAAAINAAIAAGNIPFLGPSNSIAPHYIACGLINLIPGQYIWGYGKTGCYIAAIGTGDLFNWTNPAGAFSAHNHVGGGIIGGCTISGAATGAGSAGLHFGDIESMFFQNVKTQDFNKAGSIGWHPDNRKFWTERLHLQACGSTGDTVAILFDRNGGTASYKGLDIEEFDITQINPNFDGIQLANVALYDGKFFSTGNFSSGAAASGAFLRFLANGGHFEAMDLQFTPECGAGAVQPATMLGLHAPVSGYFKNCRGLMDFSQNVPFTHSDYDGSAPSNFTGQVLGDIFFLPAATGGMIRRGVALLAGAPLVINTPAVSLSGSIRLAYQIPSMAGSLFVSAINPGVSFTVQSTNAGDTSQFTWEVWDN